MNLSTAFRRGKNIEVPISDLRLMMKEALRIRGVVEAELDLIINPYLEAELRGKQTHGIIKFFLIDRALNERSGKPKIIKEKFNYALVDGNRELGHMASNYAIDILLSKSRQYDNAFVGLINSYYYTMAGIYARRIAKEGYVGIVLNNGGPSAVVPSGGVDPIFGTNPMAIAIPTENEPLVLDMATSEKTWGEINLAKIIGHRLPLGAFIDQKGNITRNANKAKAILPFGGIKGYGLNLMVEILTGALVRAKMGQQSKNGYDLGFLFIAVSPDMFYDTESFRKDVEKLISEVKGSRRMNGIDLILLPGEGGDLQYRESVATQTVRLNRNIWEELINFSKGDCVYKHKGLEE